MIGVGCFDVGAKGAGVESRMTIGDDFLRVGTPEKKQTAGGMNSFFKLQDQISGPEFCQQPE